MIMDARILGIIGGVALVLALLSPLVLGSSKKVEQLFEAAETLYERSDYKGAIQKYKEALKESKKFGAKTERIDKDFTTLANLKIARCYYELAENTSDVRYYQNALTHIKKDVLDTQVIKHQEELHYLWAEILYKLGNLDQAESKFSWFIEKFPTSRRVPKSLYTVGEINLKQENRDEALNAFQKLVDKFPQSELTAKAELRIEELKYLPDNGKNSIPIPPPIDETMHKTASDLQQQGKIFDAYKLYTDLITKYPKSKYVTDAYVGKAEIHLEAEDYVNARANYEEAIYHTADTELKRELYEAYHRTYLVPVYGNREPQSEPTDTLFVNARLLREEKRFLEAAKIYAELANSTLPANDMAFALYWKGRCYYEAAQTDSTLFSKSVDAFKTLITDYEGSSYDIKAYYYLALSYSNWAEKLADLSKFRLVINTVEDTKAKYVDSDDGTILGWLSRMQKLKDEASEKLPPLPNPLKEEAEKVINKVETTIVRVKQENGESQVVRQANAHLEDAKEQMRDREYKTAISLAKKALEILNKPIYVPPSTQDYVNQGHRYLQQGDLEKATEKARQALNIDRNYPPTHELLEKIKQRYYSRGWTFFDEDVYDEAIAEFRNAIDIDPDFEEAHCHIGVIYIEQQKYTEAIKPLKKAISIDSKYKEAYFNLALAYLKLGEFEAAKNAANCALGIDRYYEPALMLIKYIAD